MIIVLVLVVAAVAAPSVLAQATVQETYCAPGGLRLQNSEAGSPDGSTAYAVGDNRNLNELFTPGLYTTTNNIWFKPLDILYPSLSYTLIHYERYYPPPGFYDPGGRQEIVIGFDDRGYLYAQHTDFGQCSLDLDVWTPYLGKWTMYTIIAHPNSATSITYRLFVNGISLNSCTLGNGGRLALDHWTQKIALGFIRGSYGEVLTTIRNSDRVDSDIFTAAQTPNDMSYFWSGLNKNIREAVVYWRMDSPYPTDGSNTERKIADNALAVLTSNGNPDDDGSLLRLYGYTTFGTVDNTIFYQPCHCLTTPCIHETLCLDGVNAPVCTCISGYTGSLCQTDINECASTPCQHGGVCTDLVNGFRCTCAAGYSGLKCQTDINECASNPCANGGVCTDHVNFFTCACPLGYSGLRCQTDIDECASSPCLNGKTCLDLVNGFVCVDGTEPYCHNALLFNGSFSIHVARSPILADLLPLMPMTMSMWYSPVETGGGPIPDPNSLYPNTFALADQVASSETPTGRGLSLGIGISPLGLTVWYRNVACIASSVTIQRGWHEYTGMARILTINTIELVLFVDGIRVPATSGTCRLPFDLQEAQTTTAQLRIEVGRGTNGALSNMRMWQRNFSDADILADNKFRSHYADVQRPAIFLEQSNPTPTDANIDTSTGYIKTAVGGLSPTLAYSSGGETEFPLRVSYHQCKCPNGQSLTPIPNPCSLNNATCVDDPASRDRQLAPCNCTTPGYKGFHCELQVDECASNPCQHGGLCVDGTNSYTCSCVGEWSGTHCQTPFFVGARDRACRMPQNSTVLDRSSALTLDRYTYMLQACATTFPAGDHAFDPVSGWCKSLPLGFATVTPEMMRYFNLRELCPYRGVGKFVALPFATATRFDDPSADACGQFRGWRSNDAAYFDSLCGTGSTDDSWSFDFATFSCVRDERAESCGLDVASCRRQCYANDTCIANTQTCNCTATTGAVVSGKTYCNYKISTDTCFLASGVAGFPGKSTKCAVFSEESYYNCPTATFNSSACHEVCECMPGTGNTAGSTRWCGGQDVDCTADDVTRFCPGTGAARCRKRCEFATPDYSHPLYCAFVEGSCDSSSHLLEDQCDPDHTVISQPAYVSTFLFNASLGGIQDQVRYQDYYPSACYCDADHTGFKCAIPSCPLECSGRGTCVSGKCTCTAGVPNQYTGCGCQIDELPRCMTFGYACLNQSSATVECEPCSGTGACSPALGNFSAPSYSCQCDATHLGTYCAEAACPSNCNGQDHGTCNVPGGNKTLAFCQCKSEGSCTSGDNIYGGADCGDNVCTACGATTPGGDKLTCSAHGICRRDNTSIPYACACTQGYTGQFCENAPCSPVCGSHATCVSEGSAAACVCDAGWTDLVGGSTCVTNRCALNALPVPDSTHSSGFRCECNNPAMDNSACTSDAFANHERCCTSPKCPVDAITGVTCGDNARANLYDIVPLPQCVAGACECPTTYVKNATSGTCYPLCDQARVTPASRPCLIDLSSGTCSGCACLPGYDPASGCYETTCKNGGTLVQDQNNVYCTCTTQWTGDTCETPICSGVGTPNTTSGVCICPAAYSGVACEISQCKHGGTPVGESCTCPTTWNGVHCQNNRCGIGGVPSADGESCICDAIHTGALCETSLCQHGGNATEFGTCNCLDVQYHGDLCERRRCSTTGTYNVTSATCTCLAAGVYTLDSATGNCTKSLCGALGTPTPSGLNCTCAARTTQYPILSAQHPVYCQPKCVNGGLFVASQKQCKCATPNTIQPYCDYVSSSSSTGSGNGETSDSAKRSPSVYLLLVLLLLCLF